MKRKFIFLAMLLLTLIGGVKWNVLNAQETETITIGSGANGVAFVPIQTNYNNTISQQIFLAEDFQGQSGKITSYAFKCFKDLVSYNTPITVTRNLKIYMINTDKTSFSGKSDWADIAATDLVFDGSVTFQPKDEWTVITFDTPFEYEDGKNVILCINDASAYVGLSMTYYGDNTEDLRSLVHFDDNTQYNATNIQVEAKYDNTKYVTHCQFTFESAEDCLEQFSPTNLIATVEDHNTISLTWDHAENAKKYNIYKNGEKIVTTKENYYTVENLIPETTYRFTVKSACGSIESDPSDEVEATTSEYVGGPQYRIKVIGGNYNVYGTGNYLNINAYTMSTANTSNVGVATYSENNAQIFTLEDAGNNNYYLRSEDGYYIECGAFNTWNVDAYNQVPNTPLTFEYVNTSDFYIRNSKVTGNNYFKSEASGVYCNGSISEGTTALWQLEQIITDNIVPAVPSNLAATANSHNKISLTWTEGDEYAISYNIYENDNLIAENIYGTSYIVENLPNAETEYCFTVQAVRGNNLSDKSIHACATTLAAPKTLNLVFKLKDSYGDTWNGGYLTIVGDDGTNEILQMTQGSGWNKVYDQTFTLENVAQGANITVTFTPGNYAGECSYCILYEDGEEIHCSPYMDNTSARTYNFTVKTLIPSIDVTPEAIELGTVRLGEYWSEREDASVDVVVEAINGAEIGEITSTNDFFTFREAYPGENIVEFTVGYNKNGTAGEQTGNMVIEYNETTKEIHMTATAYEAAQGDAIENPFEVTFDENGSYTYTITSLDGFYDDYIFSENEQYDANCPDVVFELTIAEGEKALVGATNANCWISRYDGFTPENGPASKHDYPETEVLSAGTYYFVLAPNSWALPFEFTLTKTAVPAPVISYSNPSDGVVNQDNPMLVWNMDYADEYQVLLGTSEEEMEVVVDWTSELTTSYQTENLQNNTQYFWQVNARNEAGTTTGEVYSFVTLLDVPAITSATAVNLYPGKATTITWDAVTNTSSYKIYNGDNLLATLEPTVTSYELSGLAYNMNGHSITVTATQEGLGESLKSNAIIVKVAGEFPLVVSVKDSNSNPIEGATVSIDMTYAYDQFGQQVNAVNPITTDAEGNVTITLPLLGTYQQYTVTVAKSPYEEVTENKNIYYYNLSNNNTYTHNSTLYLPKVSNLETKNGDIIFVEGSELVLTWEVVVGATAYKVYKNENLVETVTTNEFTTTAVYDNAGSKYAVSAVFEGELESDKTYTADYIYVLGNGSFSGFVYDEEGNSIAGLTVKLSGTNAIGEDVVILTTDAEGYFEGEVLEGDDYTLTISHYDYEKVDIPGIEIEYSNNTDLLDIVLTAKPSVKNIEVIATDEGEYANVTWTGDYAKYNVYRQAENEEPELLGEGDAETKAYTDIEWANLNYGNYKYGVSAFVEEEQQSRGVEVIFEEDFENGIEATIWNKYIDNSENVTYWYATSANNGINSQDGGNFAHTKGQTYNGYTTLATQNYIAIPENAKLIFDYYSRPWSADKDYIEVYAVDEYSNKHLLRTTDVYSQWVTEEVSLAQFAGQTVKIWFKCIIKYGYGVGLDNIKITGEGSSAKESKIVWSTTVEKKAPNTFEGTESTDWNTEANWSRNEVPSQIDDVIIATNAVISTDVNIKSITINEGATLTLASGVLNVTDGIYNENVNAFIIEDGAQLFQNNDNLAATFNMDIISPDNWTKDNQKGWQFISSPFIDATVDSFVPEGEYDLYKYDGSQELEWINHQQDNSGSDPEVGGNTEFFFDFENGSLDGLRNIDEDGDSYVWYVGNETGYEGINGGYAINSSCFQYGVLNPTNYIVTTEKYTITETSTFSFFHIQSDPAFFNEYISVVISTDNSTFTPIYYYDYEEILSDWREEIVSLSQYAGQELYLGLCHHNCNGDDANGIKVDNIRLSTGSVTRSTNAVSFEDKFVNGRGYLASYPTDATVALSGILNNNTNKTWGQYYYNAENDLANFQLLGNPFTFNMDMSKLNSYETMVKGYAVVNENGEYEYATNGTVNVGDGFFVKVTTNYAFLEYDHNYVAPVERSGKDANSINIIASGKAGKDNVVVNFAGQAEGFNKLQNFNDAIATVYVSENGKNYGIANVDENTTEVALNFDAKEMGNYTISLDVNGEFETVTLVDRFTGVETNMLLEDEYTFTATSNDNVNRFVIRLANGQEPTANSQFVYQSGEELILSIEGSVQIVDMLGRVVYSNEHANGDNRINVAEFNDAAYVVRVVNEEGVKTQKVVIY